MNFLSSSYFLGIYLNQKCIYTLCFADEAWLLAWQARGGYVATGGYTWTTPWLVTWQRSGLKRPAVLGRQILHGRPRLDQGGFFFSSGRRGLGHGGAARRRVAGARPGEGGRRGSS